jgi:hypothetical protein
MLASSFDKWFYPRPDNRARNPSSFSQAFTNSSAHLQALLVAHAASHNLYGAWRSVEDLGVIWEVGQIMEDSVMLDLHSGPACPGFTLVASGSNSRDTLPKGITHAGY